MYTFKYPTLFLFFHHQAFNALSATLDAEQAAVQSEVNEIEKIIKKLEEDWQDLQSEHERLEQLFEKTKEQVSSGSLKETLSEQIMKLERTRNTLTEVTFIANPSSNAL